MMLRLALGLLLALALPTSAQAATKVITGDKGFNRQVVRDADLYDATGATVLVEQGRNNTGYNVDGSPLGAEFRGGRTLGRGINRTGVWIDTYRQGNGACVRFEDSPRMTVRRHYGEFCWDGIKPAGSSNRPTIEEVWLHNNRDDAIEHDHVNSMSDPTLRVRRSFFDNVHTFLSITPGGGAGIQGRVSVEWIDNVMSLGCGVDDGKPCEDRDKRLKFAWSRPRGSGQAFKVRGCGDDIDILFRGNAVMMGLEETPDGWKEVGFNTAAQNLPVFQCMTVLPESTGNTFYWLGGCDFRGLEMVQLHGACVPKRFELDPAVWSSASNSLSEWQAEVSTWRAEVWEGTPPPPPDDDPPPDDTPPPPPDDPPPVDEGLIGELETARDLAQEAADRIQAVIQELEGE